MKANLFASVALATLRAASWHEPSVCPYCPDGPPGHWIKWGFYERYAETSDRRIRIPRCCCRIVERTFSLLPDALLPYRFFSASRILRWLYATVAEKRGLRAVARGEGVARGVLRGLTRAFLRTARALRLPGRPAALEPPVFLTALADLGCRAVADLFRHWKELEPKHSILGFHPR